MTLLGSRKSTQHARGVARRKLLLSAAKELLAEQDLDTINLTDVALKAEMPKTSAYHFYTNIKDLYIALVGDIEEELHKALSQPLKPSPKSWQQVIEQMLDLGVAFYESNPAARQLLIGPKTLPDIKLCDRDSDITLGAIFEEQVLRYFDFPAIPNRQKVFFRMVEIADLMFALSMLESGEITAEMSDEAKRASIAYLDSYLFES